MKNLDNDVIVTDVWRDFDKGRHYNRLKDIYNQTEQNYDFYYGNQTKYLNIGNETPIVLNIIKSIVKYKLGVINQYAYEIVYSPNSFDAENRDIVEALCKVLSKHANKVWELQQIGKKIRLSVKDACINDEGIIHYYFDIKKQEVLAEVIDKNNIYYGNENDSDIQSQPYIIISYRKPVQQVKEEAKLLGISDEKIELINYDGETLEQAGYSSTTDEVNPMCLVLLKYYKKDGKVFYSKSVKSVELETDVNTELEYYPVAHMVWEEVKGSARGVGVVRNIIPNQIEINKIATRRALSVKLFAFNKLVYNKKFIANPNSLNKVGASIELVGDASMEDVRKHVGYLNPATMSPDAKNLLDELKDYTKDLEGAGDVATGNVNPEQTSGKAIVAVQSANQQPLNEQLETFKYFIEDSARILYDMWKAYKVDGLNVMLEQKDQEGNTIEVPATLSYEDLKSLNANVKVDITPKSPYDRFAQEQSLEGLMTGGQITFEEYVEALPDDSVMPKFILERILEQRKAKQKLIDQMNIEAQAMQGQFEQAMKGQVDTNMAIDDIENQANTTQNDFVNQLGGV